jgi:hypothetical protein
MNFHIINQNAVVLNFDGKVVNVMRSTFPKYGELISALKSKDFDKVKLLFEVKVEGDFPEFIPNTGLKLIGGTLVDDCSETLPTNLSNKIIELHNDKWDVTNLVNFWNNVKENPSRHSREQLYRFLCDNEHPITDDGHFIAYRNVTKGFKDHHTGKFDNSVGNVLEMPRRDVDDDPNSHCSYGFHVAKFYYARNFKSNGLLISVKVNPRDVVAVPSDARGQKMRVCRFEVMEIIEQKLDGVDFTNSFNEVDKYSNEEKRDDWGDLTDDWDPFFDEEDELQEFIDDVLDVASNFKRSYTDVAYLSLRVSEEVEDNNYARDYDSSPAGIFKILIENRDKW